jgi:hypothetical protein
MLWTIVKWFVIILVAFLAGSWIWGKISGKTTNPDLTDWSAYGVPSGVNVSADISNLF